MASGADECVGTGSAIADMLDEEFVTRLELRGSMGRSVHHDDQDKDCTIVSVIPAPKIEYICID